MRTLEAMRPEKRRRIARETMEIYAPIANRLGLNNIYQELQDLSFRYLFPTRYRVLANATKAARGNRREMVTKILDAIKQRLKAAGLDAEVTGREKSSFTVSTRKWWRSTLRSPRCSTFTVSASSSRTCPRVTSRWARCIASTIPSPENSRTISPFPRQMATSHCTTPCGALRHPHRSADSHARNAPNRRGRRCFSLAL